MGKGQDKDIRAVDNMVVHHEREALHTDAPKPIAEGRPCSG